MATVLIKKYGNRRLYDAQLRRCVTMEEIAGFVRGGEDVRVIERWTQTPNPVRAFVPPRVVAQPR